MTSVKIDGVIVSLDRLERTGLESFSLAGKTAYYIVAVQREHDKTFRTAVEKSGGVILEHMITHDDKAEKYTYLCRIPDRGNLQLEDEEGRPIPAQIVPFPAERKLSALLVGRNPGARGITEEQLSADIAAAEPASVADAPAQRVRIDLHASVEVDEVLNEILQAAGVRATEATVLPREEYTVPPNVTRVRPGSVTLAASGAALAAIAAIDGVRRIVPIPTFELANNRAREIIEVPNWPFAAFADPKATSSEPGEAKEEFAGDGEVVAVADTGFDRGSRTNVDYAFGYPSPVADRVLAIYPLGYRRAGDDPSDPFVGDDPHGHGTHVAGSVLGSDTRQEADPAVPKGVFGVAYRARLVMQALFHNHLAPLWGVERKWENGDVSDVASLEEHIFLPPYRDHGARVHTNSWGGPYSGGTYNASCHDVDKTVERYRDLVILFSAGNEGKPTKDNDDIDGDSITVPGTAKNCITVGASENRRELPIMAWSDNYWDGKFKCLPTRDKSVAGDPEAMAPFSSCGPVEGERIKPDLVAPGTSILSTRSFISMHRGCGWSEKEPKRYMYMSGTSMATPLVAGSAAIVREYLRRKKNLDEPSAALIKAALINGAKPISGAYSGPKENGKVKIPNNHQGFGRVNVTAAIGLDGSDVTFVDESLDWALISESPDGSEPLRSWTTTVKIKRGRCLKVTLVWTDFAGEKLMSDLDLIVKKGRKEWHGNRGNSKEFDRENNVEQVTWDNHPGGDVQIRVWAERALEPQMFALVYSVK